jgi:hypothetical protein
VNDPHLNCNPVTIRVNTKLASSRNRALKKNGIEKVVGKLLKFEQKKSPGRETEAFKIL